VRHVTTRVVGLTAVAALVALAFGVATASALPEFGQCVVQPKHEGRYTNNVCTAKAKKVSEKFTGEFEWRKATEIEAAKRTFAGTGGEAHFYGQYRACEPGFNVRAQKCHEGETEGVIPFGVHCASEENSGTITGKNLVGSVSVTFKGCKEDASGSSCQSGATEEEIKFSTLKGKIGFINKKVTPREVGLLLEPTSKKTRVTTYHCDGPELSFVIGMGNEVEGCVYPLKLCGGNGVISAITPVNTATTTFTQVFTASEETAENVPSKFEGTQPLKVLESYLFRPESPVTSMWSKIGESLTNSDKTPEAIEIKAN
jgi:hypothetical protein